MLADGVEQMSLAQSDAAIEKKRVIGTSRRLRHSGRSGVRMIVVFADDEALEGVFRVERHLAPGGAVAIGTFGYRSAFDLRIGLRNARRGWGAGINTELHLEILASRLHQDIADQAQVIVLEPNLAKIVCNLQGQCVFLQGRGSDG